MYYQDLGLPSIPAGAGQVITASGTMVTPTKPVTVGHRPEAIAPGEPVPGSVPAQVPAATSGAPGWLKIAAVAALGLGGYLYWRKRKQGKKR